MTNKQLFIENLSSLIKETDENTIILKGVKIMELFKNSTKAIPDEVTDIVMCNDLSRHILDFSKNTNYTKELENDLFFMSQLIID